MKITFEIDKDRPEESTKAMRVLVEVLWEASLAPLSSSPKKASINCCIHGVTAFLCRHEAEIRELFVPF